MIARAVVIAFVIVVAIAAVAIGFDSRPTRPRFVSCQVGCLK
jgi:hypothetical protein